MSMGTCFGYSGFKGSWVSGEVKAGLDSSKVAATWLYPTYLVEGIYLFYRYTF